ncbi:MAG: NUDIX hydrolase [Bdellovibrionaceae bacterium]|nr:NUDIX hydrolase [Pseudobdellovibrionaceae bacterium]
MKNMKKKLIEKDLIEIKKTTLDRQSAKFLKMQIDEVQLSDGSTAIREYIRHPGAALIIPEIKKGQILFVKQYRYPVKQIFLEFPAGKIDRGEAPLNTAHRELKEEVGYVAKKMRYVTSIHPVIGYGDEVIHIYLAQGLTFVGASPDEGEFLVPQKMSLQTAMEKTKRHKITDVKTQIALFWYEKITKGLWSLK